MFFCSVFSPLTPAVLGSGISIQRWPVFTAPSDINVHWIIRFFSGTLLQFFEFASPLPRSASSHTDMRLFHLLRSMYPAISLPVLRKWNYDPSLRPWESSISFPSPFVSLYSNAFHFSRDCVFVVSCQRFRTLLLFVPLVFQFSPKSMRAVFVQTLE